MFLYSAPPPPLSPVAEQFLLSSKIDFTTKKYTVESKKKVKTAHRNAKNTKMTNNNHFLTSDCCTRN